MCSKSTVSGVRSEGTRTRILAAAERLFAERGFEAVSLRGVGAAAGQRNNSAVQYHFGDRDRLVRAVYEWRLAPLNARRAELISGLAPPAGPGGLAAWVDAYARPLHEVADGSSHYARFVARFVAQDAPVQFDPPLADHLASARRRVIEVVRAALHDLPEPRRAERLRRFDLYVTGVVADVEARRAAGTGPALDAADMLEDLVATATALLLARSSAHEQ